MKLHEAATAARELTVRDIMQTSVISVSADTTVEELAQLLTSKMISGVPVVDSDGEVIGVVSLSDVVANATRSRAILNRREHQPDYYRNVWLDEELDHGYTLEDISSSLTVRDIMTPVVYVVGLDETLSALTSLLLGARIHRALVTDGQAIVGIVTTMDLISVIPDLAAAGAGREQTPVEPRSMRMPVGTRMQSAPTAP